MPTAYEMAAKFFDDQLVQPLRQQVIGRKLFAKTSPFPKGTWNVDYDTITEMSAAEIAYDLPPENPESDFIKLALSTVKFPVLRKGFKIKRATWDAFNSKGIALDLEGALSAAQVVGNLEDDLLLQGWTADGTNYDIKGLNQDVGATESTSADFATFGNATIKIALVMAALEALGVTNQNYNMVLNPVQFWQAKSVRSTYGILEWADLISLLNPNDAAPKGTIYGSPDITAAYGFMSPVDPAGKYMDLMVVEGAETPRTLIAPEKWAGVSSIEVLLYEICRPRIKNTSAIYGMSGV